MGIQTEVAYREFPVGTTHSWQFLTVLNDSTPCYADWVAGLVNLTQNSIIDLTILLSTNTSLRYQISSGGQALEQAFVLSLFLSQLGGDISFQNLGYYFVLPTGEEFWNELAMNISTTFPTASVNNGESIFSFNASTLVHQTYSWEFDKATGLLRSFRQIVRDPDLNYGARTPDELYLLRTDLKSKLPELTHITVGILILGSFILFLLLRKRR